MCAPGLPNAMAVKMPATTAIPQAVVMTIQPEFSPFDFFRRTLATTPSPSRINTSVPINSPRNGPCMVRGLLLDFRNGVQTDAVSLPYMLAYGDSTQSNERVTAFFQKR